MTCPKCGADVGSVNYCPNCGTDLTKHSKRTNSTQKSFAFILLVVICFFIIYTIFKPKKESEGDRDTRMIAIATIALDRYAPDVDYPTSTSGWSVFYRPDGVINVSTPNLGVPIYVLLAPGKEEEDPTPYFIKAGDSVYLDLGELFDPYLQDRDLQESSDGSLDERNALKAEILDTAVSLGLPDTSEIVLVDNRIEISAPTEYSVDAMPETWESILQEAESTGIALQSDFQGYTVTIMYKDGEGNILLNVTDGACKYNAFEIETEPVTEEENPPTITMAEYNQIETGMTYFQVCDIIGGYGEVLSEVDLGIGSEYATEMYMWEGEGITGANANVTFQGGKVTAKAQFGLE